MKSKNVLCFIRAYAGQPVPSGYVTVTNRRYSKKKMVQRVTTSKRRGTTVSLRRSRRENGLQLNRSAVECGRDTRYYEVISCI